MENAVRFVVTITSISVSHFLCYCIRMLGIGRFLHVFYCCSHSFANSVWSFNKILISSSQNLSQNDIYLIY